MDIVVFDWDQWNSQKNEIKHGVSRMEAEGTFYDPLYKMFLDKRHSTVKEARYILYGRSLENRVLMIGFTVRKNKVRIITARPASKKERAIYENKV
ncbi:MAG: BrnT family toxin [Deltaproteobacteria bacterium]|nr:BrnT family toxin [Deltaproteobacteria bacterium]